MKEFIAQYLLNLWIYGSQAIVLVGAGRAIWNALHKPRMLPGILHGTPYVERKDQGNPLRDDLRRERAS